MNNAPDTSPRGGRPRRSASSGTLRIRVAEPSEHEEFDRILTEKHERGAPRPVGPHLRTWAEIDGERVALMVWGPACYAIRPRDLWIGWTPTQRAERQKLVLQNRRLLFLHRPGTRPNLASRVLGAALKALPGQWESRFGYVPLVAETFSDPESQKGTCYAATGWTPLGMSQGFSRHRADFYTKGSGPKRLWVKPLRADALERLRALDLAPEHRGGGSSSAHGVMPLARAQMESLHEALGRVPDPRARNVTFRLDQVLVITAMALLSGCRSLAAVHRFGQRLTQAQRRSLGLPRRRKFARVPGYSVYRQVLARTDPEAFSAVLSEWLQARRGHLPAALALDGKMIGDIAGLVGLCDQETGAPVAMAPISKARGEGDRCEIRQARRLVGRTDLGGALVSADAHHANREFSVGVLESGGDYLVQAKENVPGLAAEIRRAASGPPLLN